MSAKKLPLFEITVPITEKMFNSFVDDLVEQLEYVGVELKAKEILARPGYHEKILAKFKAFIKEGILHPSVLTDEMNDRQGYAAEDLVHGPLFKKDIFESEEKDARASLDEDVFVTVKRRDIGDAVDLLRKHGLIK